MRFFTGPSSLFDALRAQIIELLSLPSGTATQPWPAGITYLALAPHEYEPPSYASLVAYALENGATEITEAQYLSLLPPSPES